MPCSAVAMTESVLPDANLDVELYAIRAPSLDMEVIQEDFLHDIKVEVDGGISDEAL
jgi:hypothetical protein